MNGHKVDEEQLSVVHYEVKDKNSPQTTSAGTTSVGVSAQEFTNLYVKNFPTPEFDEANLNVRLR